MVSTGLSLAADMSFNELLCSNGLYWLSGIMSQHCSFLGYETVWLVKDVQKFEGASLHFCLEGGGNMLMQNVIIWRTTVRIFTAI